jgi:pimeloyl-ACP methyl ester carboxylesterase
MQGRNIAGGPKKSEMAISVGIRTARTERLAAAIAGHTEIRTIPGAGHMAELDKPDEVAAAILRWVS